MMLIVVAPCVWALPGGNDEISARPAVQKAMALKDRHKFKTEMDAEALQAMFPHLKVKVV
jgi:hypothetical protein